MMRQKGQGGSVQFNQRAPRESQLTVAPAFTWVTTQTCLEEFVINFALRVSITGFEKSTNNIVDIGFDSAFSGFAKGFSEQLITAVYSLSADAKRRGKMDLVRKYDFWAQTLIQGFYNGVFPLLKMMQLPGKSEHSRATSNYILAGMGGLGVAMHWYQRAHQPQSEPESCGQVLVQFLPREGEDE